jgi:hypothetical protein
VRFVEAPQVVPHPDLPGSSALVDGSLVLAGRLEFVDWRTRDLQVVTCADLDCGYPGCADGSYVELRVAGDLVVWAPSLRLMAGPDGFRYLPPRYFADGNTPLWQRSKWDQLAAQLHAPPASELAPLRWDEARWIAEREAPRGVLGPERLLDRVIATDPQLDPDQLKQLCDLQSWNIAPETPVRIAAAPEAERLTLFAEHPAEEWVVFGRREEEAWRPWLAPGVLLVPAANHSG